MSTLKVKLSAYGPTLVMFDWSSNDPAYHFAATSAAIKARPNLYVFKAKHYRINDGGAEELYGEEKTLALKVSLSRKAEQALKHEADLYSQELWVLQGIAVPVCYGLYKGRREISMDGGATGDTVSGLLLQYCDNSPPHLSREHYCNEVLQAALKLHKTGVMHRQSVLQHAAWNEGARIVDFSHATVNHACQGSWKTREGKTHFLCEELRRLREECHDYIMQSSKPPHRALPLPRAISGKLQVY